MHPPIHTTIHAIQGADMSHTQNRPLPRRMAQTGFTLIELAISIVIIGVLIALVLPKFRGGTNEAKAMALYEFATATAGNWRTVSNNCGTTTDVSTSPLPASTGAVNSLSLAINATGVNGTYAGCFGDAAPASLRGKVQGNMVDGFTVQGVPVVWSGGTSSGPLIYTFSNVLPEWALILYRKYSSVTGAMNASSFPAGADNSDPMIQFSATASGSPVSTLKIIIN